MKEEKNRFQLTFATYWSKEMNINKVSYRN